MKTTNDFSLSFDENILEKVYFNKYEFIYERKEKKSDYNSHVVRVTPTYINFYEKLNLNNDSTVRTYCIKVDNNLSYMKISETYNYGFVVKTDYNTCIQEGVPSIEEKHRKYDKDGHLISSFIEFKPLDCEIIDYIKQHLTNSKEIERLHNRLEDLMPGISKSLISINPDYDYIYDAYSDKNEHFQNKKKI